MSSLFCACAALLMLAIGSQAIVLPDGFQLPDACATVRCKEGYECVQIQNLSPFCVLTPCPNIPRCVRRPAVIPAVETNRASKPGNCPIPTGFGVCAFMCNSDNDCSGTQKCCRNGCGGSGCETPL